MPLPRRCLHGVHQRAVLRVSSLQHFASALPARGASRLPLPAALRPEPLPRRCLHGVHRDQSGQGIAFPAFASALPARGASRPAEPVCRRSPSLPRRCLHGVHRQKPTNCGTPFCSIRRESVDSFSEINNKDSCADYFPALFCCQGDLHHHYRQPRTGNRPVLRCEQHRLFLFILSSHYRRLL